MTAEDTVETVETYARMRSLVGPGAGELAATFRRLGEAIEAGGREGSLGFRILDAARSRTFVVTVRGSECSVADDGGATPDLEVVTRAETWWEIASGALSPVEAFLAGRLRVRGDVEWGKAILGELSDGTGVCDPCGR